MTGDTWKYNVQCRLLAGLLLLPWVSDTLSEPLYDQDNGVFSGASNFADSLEGATLVEKGRYSTSLSVIASSHSTNAQRGAEIVTLDGETTRAEFAYRFGLGQRLEVGIELPYVWHASGSFDSFIEDWHKALGLPLGSRRDRPEDQLQFAYEDDTGVRFDYQSNSNGVGDARIIAGWQLKDSPTYAVALRFGIKVPTGDSAEFHGSGSTDFSIGIAADAHELFGVSRLNGFLRAHAYYLGEPDLLSDLYRDLVGQFNTGFGYQLSKSVELRVQAAARSATYHSDIEILGQPSATLSVGGNFRISDQFQLSVAVSEDIKVRSAPDVSFQAALRYRPADSR
jgi:hypothetical protein